MGDLILCNMEDFSTAVTGFLTLDGEPSFQVPLYLYSKLKNNDKNQTNTHTKQKKTQKHFNLQENSVNH